MQLVRVFNEDQARGHIRALGRQSVPAVPFAFGYRGVPEYPALIQCSMRDGRPIDTWIGYWGSQVSAHAGYPPLWIVGTCYLSDRQSSIEELSRAQTANEPPELSTAPTSQRLEGTPHTTATNVELNEELPANLIEFRHLDNVILVKGRGYPTVSNPVKLSKYEIQLALDGWAATMESAANRFHSRIKSND